MAKIKIYELAKELSVESKDIIRKLGKMGVEAKTHMSSISQKDADAVRSAFAAEGKGNAAVPGGFALSGYTNSTNRDFSFANNGEMDSFVYIVSSYGDLQTVSSFGGSSVDNARGICSNGKTVYVCGFTNSADGSFKNCEVKGADGKGAALVYQFNLETT